MAGSPGLRRLMSALAKLARGKVSSDRLPIDRVRFERTGRNRRSIANAATLVTPTFSFPVPKPSNHPRRAVGSERNRTLIFEAREFAQIRRLGAMTTSANARKKGAQPAMHTPPIVSPEAWEAAREQLLVKEKAHTRARDALAAERRRMPWMAVDKQYIVRGACGPGQPARPVRRPASADRLPRLLRAGGVRLARPRLPRLLHGGRPGRPRRPPERP